MTTIFVREGVELPERIPFDEYLTPQPFVECAVKYFVEHIHRGDYPVLDILDPSAGKTGVWGLEIQKEFPDAVLVGLDIQDLPRPNVEYDFWYRETDFMQYTNTLPYDLIASNPPYKKVETFIEKCYGELRENRHMLFLLRANFAHSKRRFKLFKRIHLTDIIHSVERIPFYGNKTNATEYSVFVFRKSPVPDPNRITAKTHWISWR